MPDRVLLGLVQIARTEFPIPNIPSPRPPARPPSPRFLGPLPSSDPVDAPASQETTTSRQAGGPPASSGAGTPGASTGAAAPASSAAGSSSASAPSDAQQSQATPSLPPPIADMLEEILSVLRARFSQHPPYTIQRLAQLVLYPRQHYCNLVPYLHALDRVVHVTSGANRYPLPPAVPDMSAMSLLASSAGNLSINTSTPNDVGSDEAMGGALLTPIPWLARRTNGNGSDDGSDAGSSSPLSAAGASSPLAQFREQQQRQVGHLEGRVHTESTETIEGPNGMGSVETVSVSVNGIPSTGAGAAMLSQRSVTQGELLRQEQRAGVVPLSQLNRQQQQQQQQQGANGRSPVKADEDTVMSEAGGEEEEETPHARGPEEIGPADTGPQSAATASYIARGGGGGGGGPLDTRGIDVEAAVGRRLRQSSPAGQQHEAQGSIDAVPASPKREVPEEDSDAGPERKRLKECDAPSSSSTTSSSSSSSNAASEARNQNGTTTTTTTTITPPDAAEESKEEISSTAATLGDSRSGSSSQPGGA